MALKVGELFASFGIDTKDLNNAIGSIEKACGDIASSLTKAGAGLSLALTMPLIKIGKDALQTGMDFDAQMSRVGAISEATAQEFEILRDAAIQMGADSVFGATDAAKALEYMGMAGWKTDQMIAGLPGIMDLAAASGEDLGAVSDIVTDALTAFGLTASDSAHFADVLSAASSNSNTNVEMMGETFKYAAPLAGALGYSIEDCAVAIGLMANSGIKGGQAGTTLRAMLTNLSKPTDQVAAAMEKYNISLTDGTGKMLPMSTLVEKLRATFTDLTAEQKAQLAATLAGQEGMSGLLAIVNASEEDYVKLTDAINECDGATKKMADRMIDNLKGDIEEFNGAIESASISFSDYLTPSLRNAVSVATEMAEKFNAMDSSTKETIYKVVALAAAAGPAIAGLGGIVGFAGKLVPLMTALVSPIGIVAGTLALFAVAAVDANNDIGKSFTSLSKKAKTKIGDFHKTITAQIDEISKRIPALSASITEGIGGILPGVMDVATSLVIGFVDTISDNASNIIQIGQAIITNVVGGISRALPMLIPAAARMTTSIASALVSNIPVVLSSISELGNAILDGLNGIKWNELWKQFSESVQTSLGKVDGASIVANIGDAIIGAAGNLLPVGETLATEIAKTLGEFDWSSTGQKIKDMLGGLLAQIVEALPGMATKTAGIATALIDGITAGIEGIVTIGDDIMGAIVDAITKANDSNVGGAVGEAGAKILDSLLKAITEIAETPDMSNFMKKIGEGIDAALTFVGDIAGALVSYILSPSGLSVIFNAGIAIIDVLCAGIGNALSGLSAGIFRVLQSTLNAAIKEVLGWFGVNTDFMAQKANEMTFAAVDAQGNALFDAAGNQITKKGVELLSIIQSSTANVAEKAAAHYALVAAGYSEAATGFSVDAYNTGTIITENLISGMETNSSSDAESAYQLAVLMMNGLGDGIVASNDELFTKADQLMLALSGAMSSEDVKTAFSSVGYTITDAMALSIAQNGTTLEGTCKALGIAMPENLAESLDQNWNLVTAQTAKGAQEVQDAINELGYNCGEIFGYALPNGAKIGVENGMYVLRNATGDVIDQVSLVNNKSSIEMGAKGATKAGMDSAAKGIDENASTPTDSASAVATSIVSAFDSLPEDQKAQAEAMLEAVNLAITAGTPAAEATMKTAADAIVKTAADIMSNGAGTTIGTDFTDGIKSAVSSAMEAMKTAAKNVATSVKNAASTVLSYRAGSSIGKQFDNGIAAGIRSGMYAITAAAREAAQAALSAAKDKLGIRSPSKVAEKEIGYMYDAGLAKGILGQAALVAEAASKVSDNLHESFYVGDPSRGTVYTSRNAIQQTAQQTAEESSEKQPSVEKAEAIGRAIADRLIESGALDCSIIMDGEEVGKRVSAPVSKAINSKTKRSIKGRSYQGVLV